MLSLQVGVINCLETEIPEESRRRTLLPRRTPSSVAIVWEAEGDAVPCPREAGCKRWNELCFDVSVLCPSPLRAA